MKGLYEEKMFVNKIWFSNDVKNAKNNNRIKNNNPSTGQQQQNQIFALDYVCAFSFSFISLSLCSRPLSFAAVLMDVAHTQALTLHQHMWRCYAFMFMSEMVEAHSKCMQIFAIAYLYERIRFSSMAALMQLKYSVSMAHTFVSHIQYAGIYFLHTHILVRSFSLSLFLTSLLCLYSTLGLLSHLSIAARALSLSLLLHSSLYNYCIFWTVHSFVRFFASAKIFNLNMYNASKKLPSTSINIDRLTVSGIHLKDLFAKSQNTHESIWLLGYHIILCPFRV